MSRIFNAVTGPSGAGKSAFCRQQTDWEHRLYNLDEWAAKHGEVNEAAVRENAWTDLLGRLLADMHTGFSPITLDHVFDSRTIDEVVSPAKQLGYGVVLWVICPDDPEICVQRVRRRKEEGGHGRSAWAVRELYDNALHVAAELSTLSAETRLIDSSSGVFEDIGRIRDFRLIDKAKPVPAWVTDHFLSFA